MRHSAFHYSSLTIALALASQSLQASTRLEQINVVAKSDKIEETTTVTPEQRQGSRDIKGLFASALDIDVMDLQRTRAGNDSVNIRGLQGNRVGMAIDGIPLPESQESKLFSEVGIAFGRGNFIEPSGLKAAHIQRHGSSQGLSGSVNFETLAASDLLQNKAVAGVLATHYHSLDRTFSNTIGVAAQNARYQGLLLSTYRQGHERQTRGRVGGIGEQRTKANPSETSSGYFLLKNDYQINDKHRVGLVFEHLKREVETVRLSSLSSPSAQAASSHAGTASHTQHTHRTHAISSNHSSASMAGRNLSVAAGRPNVSSTQTLSDYSDDVSYRQRLSLIHQYRHENWDIKSSAYYQLANTENYRLRAQQRHGLKSDRIDHAWNKDKLYGVRSDVTQFVEGEIAQVLRYGIQASWQTLSNQLTSAQLNRKPSADTQQLHLQGYVEDEIVLGNWVLTPHLGLAYYHLKPTAKHGYVQRESHLAPIQSQRKAALLPKLTAMWKINDIFQPYVQYSRGLNFPSAQQLTTSFGNTTPYYSYSVIGNPRLKPETADNIEIGMMGKNALFSYRLSAYQNYYRHFIDYRSHISGNSMLVHYDNMAKAKIHGVDVDAHWYITPTLSFNTGLSYSHGRTIDDAGKRKPINTISPLKMKAGLAYDSEKWGASVLLTHTQGKADKDIDGSMYNPSRAYHVVDFALYYKPTKAMTFHAGVQNAFNQKYWHWADIAYLAGKNGANASYDGSVVINKQNADAYSAAGRQFNLGLRYEF